MERIDILELEYGQLEKWMVEGLGEPKFRAAQVWQWVWQKLARDFASMTDVAKKLRQKLAETAVIEWPEIEAVQTSRDGTTKFLLRFKDGAMAETVLIPSEDRAGSRRWTQCLSSQIGCPMQCAFCATGQMGFRRNMSSGEILGQVLVARDYLDDRRADWPILRNIVFMGMGEPLLNMSSLIPALRVLGHERGLNFSPRRITVSTCGIEKGLRELGEGGLAYLAVSLHAPTQELRGKIMPKAATWHLDDMVAALACYPLKTRERITFEYLLLGGINDSIEHAKKLAGLVGRVKGKLNLIVYNPTPGLPFVAPEPEQIEKFQKYLWNKNVTAILRKSKGADIAAACGQLKCLVEQNDSGHVPAALQIAIQGHMEGYANSRIRRMSPCPFQRGRADASARKGPAGGKALLLPQFPGGDKAP